MTLLRFVSKDCVLYEHHFVGFVCLEGFFLCPRCDFIAYYKVFVGAYVFV